jgi:hypothetical protein
MRSALKPHLPEPRPLGLFSNGSSPQPRAAAATRLAEEVAAGRPGAAGLDGLPTPSRRTAASSSRLPRSSYPQSTLPETLKRAGDGPRGEAGVANAIETAIRDAGYAGYRWDHAVALCRPTKVRRHGRQATQQLSPAVGEGPGALAGAAPAAPAATAASRTSLEADPSPHDTSGLAALAISACHGAGLRTAGEDLWKAPKLQLHSQPAEREFPITSSTPTTLVEDGGWSKRRRE